MKTVINSGGPQKEKGALKATSGAPFLYDNARQSKACMQRDPWVPLEPKQPQIYTWLFLLLKPGLQGAFKAWPWKAGTAS